MRDRMTIDQMTDPMSTMTRQTDTRDNIIMKEMSETERPYEKSYKYGVETLSDAELLAVILRTGSQKAIIDQVNNLIYNALCDRAEIKALREKEPQQVICVFVRAALPRFMRLGKVDRRTELFLQSAELRKLRAVIQADTPDGQSLENPADHIFR